MSETSDTVGLVGSAVPSENGRSDVDDGDSTQRNHSFQRMHLDLTDEVPQTLSVQALDIDTSSITFSPGVQIIDVEGERHSYSRSDSRVTSGSSRNSRSWWQYASADSVGDFSTEPSMEEYAQFIGLEETALVQAVVFIEDAYKYRSINHKVDEWSLRLYRRYHSSGVHIFRWLVIFVLHILAFFEFPSSLTWTADIRTREKRVEVPCWAMEGIELTCLLLLLADNAIRGYLQGKFYYIRHKWDVAGIMLLVISLIDWGVSVGMGCTEVVRFRRILRPFFIIQNSSLMKKIVNCLRMTLPEVLSVLTMLCMHLYCFTLFGMLLFPTPHVADSSGNHTHPDNVAGSPSSADLEPAGEGNQFFSSVLESFMSLLVLLTTANNPDVTMPAYSQNRLYAIFFILFLIIGLYCFWNMLTAVIYNQFRGYFLTSMQSSLFRRRLGVRAAFEVLRRKKALFKHGSSLATVSAGVGGFVIKSVLEKSKLPMTIKNTLLEAVMQHPELIYSCKDFQELMIGLDMEFKPPAKLGVRWSGRPFLFHIQQVIVHQYFSYFGIFVAVCNVVVITVELGTEFSESFDDSVADLRVVNFAFANYYLVEQLLKIWANGLRRYVQFKSNIFDAIITLALVVGELYSAIRFGIPFFYGHRLDSSSIITLWNILRIINILIMVRLFRIIPLFKSMRVISIVLLDLVRNMKAFAGVLIVIYYSFAILGMELFSGVIVFHNATDSNHTFDCGSYQQLEYWSNNFDDFAAAIVVLWDVMVVNNWMVFLEAYRAATSAWSYLYFVAWWLISVIIVLNLFTALIMENFITKWDRSLEMRRAENEESINPVTLNSVHDMFRGLLKEPADNELLMHICLHRHLELER